MQRSWREWNAMQWGCGGFVLALSGVLVVFAIAVLEEEPHPLPPQQIEPQPRAERISLSGRQSPRSASLWNRFPKELAQKIQHDVVSNIHPEDYAGPDACKDCHPKNHANWSEHAHRWMNAIATAEIVKGDFSGEAEIRYLGGTGRFSESNGQYRMHLTRNDVQRVYLITQTIGSRFFQYYIGKLETGPEPPNHQFYHQEHVLPFGYWLEEKEWVPTVHIKEEMPDFERADPFTSNNPYRTTPAGLPPNSDYAVYSDSCVYCHSTFPLGDLMMRTPENIGQHAPGSLDWNVGGYLQGHHPEAFQSFLQWRALGSSSSGFQSAMRMKSHIQSLKNAVSMGISCEACHFGCREHVDDRKVMPRFLPHSEHLVMSSSDSNLDDSRSRENVNWICGRCHTGIRPYYAAGYATWNSTEFSDAKKGSCYSQLTCVTCHDPHQSIGQSWSQSQVQDDATCLKCHNQFESEEQIVAHTHHPAGSPGSGCMNCHMPRINEGMQDLVRTHAIFSPTQKEMIESNHPNACNMCHTDQPIDWTLKHLEDWFQAEFDEQQVAASYPHRKQPVSSGWLKSDDPAVRLVAAGSLARSQGDVAVAFLTEALNDRFLVNRQFAERQLERLLDIELTDFGYHFYMTPQERAGPIERLRAMFASNKRYDKKAVKRPEVATETDGPRPN